MTCQEFDIILCDYVDGTLGSEAKARVEAHLAGCAECAELVHDSTAVLQFLERVPDVDVPPALVTKILNQTPQQAVAIPTPRGLYHRLVGRWLEPVLQPRMVMGMAMTILSFAMLGRFAGIEARPLRAADLDPVKIWEATEDRAHRSWNQAVKYYEGLRIVFEVQSRLRELSDKNEETEKQTPAKAAEPKAEEKGKQSGNSR